MVKRVIDDLDFLDFKLSFQFKGILFSRLLGSLIPIVPVVNHAVGRTVAKTYLSIDLASVVSKIFEKLVSNSRRVDHLERCGIFCEL